MLQRSGNIVSLTRDGTRLFQQLNGEIGRLTAQMWDGLDPADTTVAARVLRQLLKEQTSFSQHDYRRVNNQIAGWMGRLLIGEREGRGTDDEQVARAGWPRNAWMGRHRRIGFRQLRNGPPHQSRS